MQADPILPYSTGYEFAPNPADHEWKFSIEPVTGFATTVSCSKFLRQSCFWDRLSQNIHAHSKKNLSFIASITQIKPMWATAFDNSLSLSIAYILLKCTQKHKFFSLWPPSRNPYIAELYPRFWALCGDFLSQLEFLNWFQALWFLQDKAEFKDKTSSIQIWHMTLF